MTHVLLAAAPHERAELTRTLRLDALARLVAPEPDFRLSSADWTAFVARQRLTSRCLRCPYVRRDMTLEQARRAFAEHDCV